MCVSLASLSAIINSLVNLILGTMFQNTYFWIIPSFSSFLLLSDTTCLEMPSVFAIFVFVSLGFSMSSCMSCLSFSVVDSWFSVVGVSFPR